jgi:hypothetical protein
MPPYLQWIREQPSDKIDDKTKEEIIKFNITKRFLNSFLRKTKEGVITTEYAFRKCNTYYSRCLGELYELFKPFNTQDKGKYKAWEIEESTTPEEFLRLFYKVKDAHFIYNKNYIRSYERRTKVKRELANKVHRINYGAAQRLTLPRLDRVPNTSLQIVTSPIEPEPLVSVVVTLPPFPELSNDS